MHPLIGRFWQSIVTVWAAISLGFILIHQLPSGPMQMLLAFYSRAEIDQMSNEEIKEITEEWVGFAPTDPLWVQYLDYWEDVLTLDLGHSFFYNNTPLVELLAPAVPFTVLMAVLAMAANMSLGLTLGAFMAYREGSRFDVGSTFISVILGSVPYFVWAILLLIYIGYGTGWFPTSGRYANDVTVGFNMEFIISALHHVSLPFISMTFTSFAALGIRAHSIRILGSDYIRVARLRGLTERRIVFNYVLRNSLLPYYTGFVVGLVGIFGGSVIVERIFSYVGVGWYLYIGARVADIPMVLASFAMFTVATVIMLFVVDLTYSFVDPRAEGVGSDESF